MVVGWHKILSISLRFYVNIFSLQMLSHFVLIPLEPCYKVGNIFYDDDNDITELISSIHITNTNVNIQEEYKDIENIFVTHH